MKKTIVAIAILLGIGLSGMAQEGGGMLRRSQEYEQGRNANRMGYRATGDGIGLALPTTHGGSGDVEADPLPLGSGVAVLLGLGAAYLVGKKRREE